MKTLLTASALGATLTMGGCATVANGRHQNVVVVSEPSGADVSLNGESVGATPVTVRMRRRGPAELELRKAGFATETVSVPRGVSRWIAGNLVWLNPLAAQGGIPFPSGWRRRLHGSPRCSPSTCSLAGRMSGLPS